MRTITDCAIECMDAYRKVFKTNDPTLYSIAQNGKNADVVFQYATFYICNLEDGWTVWGFRLTCNTNPFYDLMDKHSKRT